MINLNNYLASMNALIFRWARLHELTAPEWHAVMAAREAVFIVEQNCPYQDADALDAQSWHLIGTCDGQFAAYLRVVDPGAKYAEPSMGRVITAPEVRGTGWGRQLVAEGVARCEAAWPGRGQRISAQAHLQAFYGSFGFRTVGEPYSEDDIPHVEMQR